LILLIIFEHIDGKINCNSTLILPFFCSKQQRKIDHIFSLPLPAGRLNRSAISLKISLVFGQSVGFGKDFEGIFEVAKQFLPAQTKVRTNLF